MSISNATIALVPVVALSFLAGGCGKEEARLRKGNDERAVLQQTSQKRGARTTIDEPEQEMKMTDVYVCDICGDTFGRTELDEHFAELAKQAAASKGVTWSGKLVTFDANGKAWCPHCFEDATGMQSGRRTVHLGQKTSYLRAPNVEINYECKCGRKSAFNSESVNIYTGLELTCRECGAILWVPPTIFDHSQPSEPGEASLRANYKGQMEFVKYRKSELDQQLKEGGITEQEYKAELKRRGL